jgi:hypothetical protein
MLFKFIPFIFLLIMVASSINAAGGYTDQKGNFVKVDSTGKVTGIVPPVKKDVM